ncbi:uncharacterized protein [Asterias amurensis]|uniref:uncharacterized protein n=1 Tax=Asterias amurensis TaxID=7602 RepID=UPI003AB3D7B0
MDSLQVARYFPMAIRDTVFIRPVKETDASALFQAVDQSRATLGPYLPWVSEVKKVEDSADFIKSAMAQESYGNGLHCVIYGKDDQGEVDVFGVVSLRTINVPAMTADMGYWLRADKVGNGLCSKSCKKLIEYGQAIGIERFILHIGPKNAKSLAVATSVGFQKQPGTVRDVEPFTNKVVDYYVYLFKPTPKPPPKSTIERLLLLGVVVLLVAMALRLPDQQEKVLKRKHLLLVGGGWNQSWYEYMYDVAQTVEIDISVAEQKGHWVERLVLTKQIYTVHTVDTHGTADKLSKEIYDILTTSGIEFSGVTTNMDRYLIAVATAAKKAGLPTLDPEVFANVRDKVVLKSLIKSTVPLKRISSYADLDSAAEAVGFPAVVRPVSGVGSLSTLLLQSKSELIKVYTKLQRSVDAEKLYFEGNTDLMLEKYVTGKEYDVDVIMQKGVVKFAAITLNTVGTAPWFQEKTMTIPTSSVNKITQKKMAEFAVATCNQVGLTDGVFHVEMIMDGDRPHLIEINARLPGLKSRHTVKAAYGVDLLESVFKIALGEQVEDLSNKGILDDEIVNPRYITTHYINVEFSGIVKNNTFLEGIAQDTRVIETEVMVIRGQRVNGPEEAVPFLLGSFMVQSEISDQEAIQVSEYLLETLDQKLVIEPLSDNVQNTPVVGMEDIFGLQRRKFRALSGNLEAVSLRYGFEELLVPIVERSTSFAEDVVGLSPWPEWDPRGCFFFEIQDYAKGFTEKLETTSVLLIPEGTLSAARWLGREIADKDDITFPIKIFYNVPCFRNEPTDTLSSRKKRQFDQFGVEILGAQDLGADVEIICMLGDMLEAVGIPKGKIVFRISNVQILIQLVKDSEISHLDTIRVKEAMDEIAECRAKKESGCVEDNERAFWNVLNKYNLNQQEITSWDAMLHHTTGEVDAKLRAEFSPNYKPLFDDLEDISLGLTRHGFEVVVDLCVVRSHEYYTHFSFEVDVVDGSRRFLEIAGGGRYNKLVGHFIKDSSNHHKNITAVPSTGFAFGIQRLMVMLDEMNAFQENLYKKLDKIITFDESSADVLLVPDSTVRAVDGYLGALYWLKQQSELSESRVDIYIGESGSGDDDSGDILEKYRKQRQIERVVYRNKSEEIPKNMTM